MNEKHQIRRTNRTASTSPFRSPPVSVCVDLGGGFTSLIAGYCVEKLGQGTVFAIDHQAEFADATRSNIARHQLDAAVRIRHAPLKPITIDRTSWDWYDSAAFGDVQDIDLLIVDGPTQHGSDREMVRFPALPVLLPKLNQGAIVLVDDADRTHETRIVERWTEQFPVSIVRRIPTEKGTVVLRYDS